MSTVHYYHSRHSDKIKTEKDPEKVKEHQEEIKDLKEGDTSAFKRFFKSILNERVLNVAVRPDTREDSSTQQIQHSIDEVQEKLETEKDPSEIPVGLKRGDRPDGGDDGSLWRA